MMWCNQLYCHQTDMTKFRLGFPFLIFPMKQQSVSAWHFVYIFGVWALPWEHKRKIQQSYLLSLWIKTKQNKLLVQYEYSLCLRQFSVIVYSRIEARCLCWFCAGRLPSHTAAQIRFTCKNKKDRKKQLPSMKTSKPCFCATCSSGLQRGTTASPQPCPPSSWAGRPWARSSRPTPSRASWTTTSTRCTMCPSTPTRPRSVPRHLYSDQ